MPRSHDTLGEDKVEQVEEEDAAVVKTRAVMKRLMLETFWVWAMRRLIVAIRMMQNNIMNLLGPNLVLMLWRLRL
jgi:hypothetical protein